MTEWTYGANGRLASISDSSGQSLSLGYNGANMIFGGSGELGADFLTLEAGGLYAVPPQPLAPASWQGDHG